MMDQSTFHKQLLSRYINNTASEAELEVIAQLIRTAELDSVLMAHMQENWQLEEAVFESERMGTEMLKGESGRSGAEMEMPVRKFKLWPRIAAAVAAVAAIVFGLYFFKAQYMNGHYPEGPSSRTAGSALIHDIAPGKNTAILTLANGKAIALSDAKTGVLIEEGSLKYNDGSVIQNSSGIQEQLTVTTPRGGTYQVTLPDGTRVWLNAASSITYTAPVKGPGAVRKVTLNGEAYFEVFKNKNQAFVVKSKNQEVTVLGTHFNINAYHDENSIKTTLLEGSVRVSSLASGAIILKPNQQSLNTGSTINVKPVDPNEAVTWKNGYFSFSGENLEEVMKQLARWYDLQVVFDEPALKQKTFIGSIGRFEQLSKVLNMLSRTHVAAFNVEGKTIRISKYAF